MKKVFVVYNGSTDVYGMPFVSDDLDSALKAVCSAISSEDRSTILACSRLFCIALYDDKRGEFIKTKRVLVSSSSDLLNAASKFSSNVVAELDESIRVLSQLREFYTEVKKNDGSCIQQG